MNSMNEHGIIYYSANTKCLVRLLVSLYSLRQVCDAPVTIMHASDDSDWAIGVLDRITDAIDNVRRQPVTVTRQKRHGHYVAKAGLWRQTPYASTIFLDADTVVTASPEPLWSVDRCLFTYFSHWQTTGRIVQGRLKQWRKVTCDGIDVQRLYQSTQQRPMRALNTGVFAFHCERGSAFLADWERLTTAGHRCSFTDELSAQLLMVDHAHYGLEFTDDRWNFSPIYGKASPEAVAIYHCHGSKHVVRPSNGRGSQGHAIWWPRFVACWQANLAGVRGWAPAGDKYLKAHLAGARAGETISP